MSDPATPMAVDDEDLDSLPVQVVLELGRVQMSLGELRQLAPGVLLPVSRNADDAIDVVVNGKRIGRAGLVRVGDGLGVRISRLTQDG
jgi:type III secretion protein Q